MAESHLVPLRKESGGSTLTAPDGTEYTWAKDGDVTGVPYEWALELLRLGGFEVADEKQAQAAAQDHAVVAQSADHGHDDMEQRQVIEPAPGVSIADRIVTEPGPVDAEITEGSGAPESGHASPITPKPRAGTRSSGAKK